jgi:hypothetical protein
MEACINVAALDESMKPENTERASQTARAQSGIRSRMTLNKQIANAPTLARKWETALLGGNPPTSIQRLPSEAVGLMTPSPHGEEWRTTAIEQLKQRFTDLLFPALLKDDTRPFEELIQAMRKHRKARVSLPEFIRLQGQQRKLKPTKKEIGRRLRLALLNLNPDDLVNIRTVKAALGKVEMAFQKWHGFEFSLTPDDPNIYAVMKELNLRFLRPGDAARWIHGGKVVRRFWIQRNGKPKESGMALNQVKALGSYRCQTSFCHGQNEQAPRA